MRAAVISAVVLFSALAVAPSGHAVSPQEPERNSRGQIRVSPRVTVKGDIDGVQILIEHGSPYARGRVIWGGLRPWAAAVGRVVDAGR